MSAIAGAFSEYTKSLHHRELFTFRVLTEWHSIYGVFIATCIETGSVATADSADMAEDMIKELLLDEACWALDHNGLPNLYSTPATLSTWLRCSLFLSSASRYRIVVGEQGISIAIFLARGTMGEVK